MLGPESRAARKVHERPGDNNMKLFRAAITSAAFVAIGTVSRADPAPAIHYAPAENLEHADVALIDSAKNEIDFAAYVLTDWPVIQALTRAADRGGKVRIYLDCEKTVGSKAFQSLAETPSVDRMHAQNFSIAAPNSVEHSHNSSSTSRVAPNG
jgi:phosphatidylserine/phosphatidylglycerophosphate/cardiolipin synthase-like enzyme